MAKSKNKSRLFIELSAIAFLGLCGRSAVAQSLTCPQSLVFGDIVTCANDSTVVITPGNTRTVNGCLSAGSAPFSRARCTLTQPSPPQAVQISITASTCTLSAGPHTIRINDFHVIDDANGRVYTATTSYLSVPIGATLNVGSRQGSGSYSGAFTININFQ